MMAEVVLQEPELSHLIGDDAFREGAVISENSGKMVWIPGGTFLMGSDHHYPEEAPSHRVKVGGFWMDVTAVTNEDFGRFVAETNYLTLAERPARHEDYPDAPPEMLVPASAVFVTPAKVIDRTDAYKWWSYVPGASWRHPRGFTSSIEGLEKHPVVHVAYDDAEAYARWAGKELPTEAEFEFAARGGLDGQAYVWGDELQPEGRIMANTWQGEFPWQNTALDGYEWTAPVGSYPSNGYGLYDMAGNVWQWTSDWYQDHDAVDSPCCTTENPRGGSEEKSCELGLSGGHMPRKVIKGGSFLCAPTYCQRYRPAARMAQTIDSTTCHVGFRCIRRPVAHDNPKPDNRSTAISGK
jgi:formylglycine-generating enzyme